VWRDAAGGEMCGEQAGDDEHVGESNAVESRVVTEEMQCRNDEKCRVGRDILAHPVGGEFTLIAVAIMDRLTEDEIGCFDALLMFL
jgi:hypothetical protein